MNIKFNLLAHYFVNLTSHFLFNFTILINSDHENKHDISQILKIRLIYQQSLSLQKSCKAYQ